MKVTSYGSVKVTAAEVGYCGFTMMPREVMTLVIGRCNPEGIGRCGRVCRAFYNLTHDADFRTNILERKLTEEGRYIALSQMLACQKDGELSLRTMHVSICEKLAKIFVRRENLAMVELGGGAPKEGQELNPGQLVAQSFNHTRHFTAYLLDCKWPETEVDIQEFWLTRVGAAMLGGIDKPNYFKTEEDLLDAGLASVYICYKEVLRGNQTTIRHMLRQIGGKLFWFSPDIEILKGYNQGLIKIIEALRNSTDEMILVDVRHQTLMAFLNLWNKQTCISPLTPTPGKDCPRVAECLLETFCWFFDYTQEMGDCGIRSKASAMSYIKSMTHSSVITACEYVQEQGQLSVRGEELVRKIIAILETKI